MVDKNGQKEKQDENVMKRFTRIVPCPKCSGRVEPDRVKDCEKCGGSGCIEEEYWEKQ